MAHHPRPAPITRRDALKLSGFAAGSALLTSMLPRSARAAMHASVRPAASGLRIAHMTDIHVQPELRGGEGLTACLKHIGSLPAARKPDLILTGGDLVMDTFDQQFARSKQLWDLFTGTVKDHAPVPVEHCLGNHDIWGWNKSKSGTSGQEPQWGKKWALEALALPAPYRAIERSGWKIIILDSVHTDPKNANGYIGRLDDQQFAWLSDELKRTPAATPILVVSHIPILSVCSWVWDGAAKEKDNRWEVSAGNLHIDGVKLHKLFTAHPNVKLCLSGHIHKTDHLSMDGVTYICDGAVCGAWWKGRKDRCDEGYGIIDLMPDGTFKHEYVTYGWKAEA